MTINIPDDLPTAIVQQKVTEFEAKLNRLTQDHKAQKRQALRQIAQKCVALPTLDQRPPDEILGYDGNAAWVVGESIVKTILTFNFRDKNHCR